MAFDVRLLYKAIERSQETCVIQFVHGHIEICTSTSVISTSFFIGSSRYVVFFIKIGCTTIVSLCFFHKDWLYDDSQPQPDDKELRHDRDV